VTGLTGVKALVGSGYYCSGLIALKEDGSAWTWSFNTTDATPADAPEHGRGTGYVVDCLRSARDCVGAGSYEQG
jgi:hypothetical protein